MVERRVGGAYFGSQRAVGTYERMLRAGVDPNCHTFNVLVSAHQAGGQWEAAEAALAEMRRRGVAPNSITCGEWEMV